MRISDWSSDVCSSDLQTIINVMAQPPTGSEEYDVWTSNDAGANYSQSASGIVYTPVGTLSGAITSSAGFTTGILATVVIASDSDEIQSVTAAEVLQGAGMFYIGTELFAHTDVTDNEIGRANV